MLKEMINILLNEDDLGAVIRAHILIEQHIEHFIVLNIFDKFYFEKMNIDFSNKTKLAIALGLEEEIYKPINAINSIRNKFAHRADFKLDNSVVNNFYKSFTSEDREGIQDIITNNPDRPPRLADKYSKLTVKEQFVAMVIWLSIRIEQELTAELEHTLSEIDA